LLLLQVPPAEISLNVIVEPEHTEAAPVMEAGKGLTEIVAVATEELQAPVTR
jgi:hypothetical protein